MSAIYFIGGISIAMSFVTLALVTVFFRYTVIVLRKNELEYNKIIIDSKETLKRASEINQALAMKVEIIEDAVKSLDFYRNQGKK